MNHLRIAAIDYLNPAPLMWDFEHEPEKTRLAERYSIHYTTPSQCAAQLAQGTADIGLVPIAAYATTPGLAVIPGCTIASIDHVRSILLVVKSRNGAPAAAETVRRVSADTSSRTSLAYTKILFRKYWNASASFTPHAPQLEAMLHSADAAMLIGDAALLALEDSEAREQRTGEKLLYVDLAHEWKERTGVPWVSAFWAARPAAVKASGVSADEVTQDFLASRDRGMAHIDDLVAEWSGRIAVPAETIRAYLTTNIHYVLDEECVTGLQAFFRYAAEARVLPEMPGLRML